MSKHDVFISYKTEDFAEASWVKAVPEENNLTCWMVIRRKGDFRIPAAPFLSCGAVLCCIRELIMQNIN